MSETTNREFGIDPEMRQTILSMRLNGQHVYQSKIASIQRIHAIKKGLDKQAQYLFEKFSQDFTGQYCVLAVPIVVKMTDGNTDKILDAAAYLSNHFKRLDGLQLGRKTDCYIVETGEAVVIETKW